MIDNLFDLLDIVPNPVPAGSIPYYDGCDWKTVVLPEAGMNTCVDVRACIDNAYILSILQVDNSLSVSGNVLHVNETWINSVVNVIRNAPNLTIGDTIINISNLLGEFSLSFNDGSNSFSVSHLDTVQVEGLDGMRFLATAPNRLQVGLPNGAAHMQVLTWDDEQEIAIWNNNQCCAQTLSFDTDNNVLCISGTNCVDLTSINTDNQELALAGNLLSITQLGSGPQAVDLTNVNEHTISLTDNILSIIGSDGVVNATVDMLSVGPKTLAFNDTTNEVSILDDTGAQQSSVDISGVNNQELSIQAGPSSCADGWAQIGISQPDGSTQWVGIPKAPIQCCADVMNCPGVVAMQADIVALFNTAAQLQTQINAVQAQIP